MAGLEGDDFIHGWALCFLSRLHSLFIQLQERVHLPSCKLYRRYCARVASPAPSAQSGGRLEVAGGQNLRWASSLQSGGASLPYHLSLGKPAGLGNPRADFPHRLRHHLLTWSTWSWNYLKKVHSQEKHAAVQPFSNCGQPVFIFIF